MDRLQSTRLNAKGKFRTLWPEFEVGLVKRNNFMLNSNAEFNTLEKSVDWKPESKLSPDGSSDQELISYVNSFCAESDRILIRS